jgi:bifunctional UDP-N-acetylglucosamine pyrophosphorylase/glucosamine-1-phosphate N-acetyltransferase
MTDPDETVPTGSTTAVILAAGLGTRMRSHLPKVLHPLLGRPMLAYMVDAAVEATGRRPVVVWSPAVSAVRDAFAGTAELARQDEPRGSGDALRAGLAAVADDAREVLVLNGDVPLIDPALLSELLDVRREDEAAISVLTLDAIDPRRLGRVVRDAAGLVERVVEAKDAAETELLISEINTGLYAMDATWLRRRIGDLTPSVATGELYLTQLIELARRDGRVVSALEVPDDGTLLGINDRAELADAVHRLQARINEAHLVAGVAMDDPSTAYIEPEVELARDVVLEPNVILRGTTSIGEGSRIGAGSQIVDSRIGRNCVVWASIVERSEVEDDVRIGPFSHLRPGSSIARGAELGNYAEVKNSRLGEGVRQHHFSYLGDADVGAGTNVGAGTVTANYDGQQKLRTTIGEGAFLGVDTTLVAPVTVGEGAKTGAGAVVTHDVPAGSLVVGVPARPLVKPVPSDKNERSA